MIIGIDPGVSGALVALDGNNIDHWLVMPVIKQGKSRRVNVAEVGRFLRKYPDAHVALERVSAMPGQGVTSMFSFGHAAGSVWGACGALGLPVTMIAPAVWKRRAGIIGQGKDASRSRSIELWPDWEALSKKGQGQALGDAALIAKFCEVH